tara:strand:+ start:305 stop:643 length:339 start_codon:yes stop_codon:yes gene_type:complete
MFKDLFNFQKERTPIQALGFYIVYFIGAVVLGGISGGVFATDFESGLVVGHVIGVGYCLFIGFQILLKKDQLNSPYTAFLFIVAILSYFIGALGGLIPVAYLSTIKNSKSDL